MDFGVGEDFAGKGAKVGNGFSFSHCFHSVKFDMSRRSLLTITQLYVLTLFNVQDHDQDNISKLVKCVAVAIDTKYSTSVA